MDGFSGYKKRKMAPDDMQKTYLFPFKDRGGKILLPCHAFRLKKAGVTYQSPLPQTLTLLIHLLFSWLFLLSFDLNLNCFN